MLSNSTGKNLRWIFKNLSVHGAALKFKPAHEFIEAPKGVSFHSMQIKYLRSRFEITHVFDTMQICDVLSGEKMLFSNCCLIWPL